MFKQPKKKILIIAAIFFVLVISAVIIFLFLKNQSSTKEVVKKYSFTDEISVQQAITQFTTTTKDEENKSFQRLDYFIQQDSLHPGAAKFASQYLQDNNDNIRFAAVYLLGNTGNDEEKIALVPLLNDKNKNIQIITASYLIGIGEKTAVPILISFLGSSDVIKYSDPPLKYSEFALSLISQYVDYDSVNNNINDLQWDAELKKYIIKE